MTYKTMIFTAGAMLASTWGLTACSQASTPSVEATTSAAGSDQDAANIAIIKKLYADVGAGDMGAFAAAFAPDVVWMEAENFPYDKTNPHVGLDAIMAGVFGPLSQDFKNFEVVREHMVADADEVVMFGRYKGVSTASGKTMNPQAVHHWTLKDGKIAGFQQYIDTLHVKEVMTP